MGVLGDNIKRYRKEKGLTQKELAKKVKVKHNSISDWERGICKPDADTLGVICWALDVDANTILGWNDLNQIKKDADELAETIISNKKIKNILSDISKMDDNDMDMVKALIDRLMKKG